MDKMLKFYIKVFLCDGHVDRSCFTLGFPGKILRVWIVVLEFWSVYSEGMTLSLCYGRCLFLKPFGFIIQSA